MCLTIFLMNGPELTFKELHFGYGVRDNSLEVVSGSADYPVRQFQTSSSGPDSKLVNTNIQTESNPLVPDESFLICSWVALGRKTVSGFVVGLVYFP